MDSKPDLQSLTSRSNDPRCRLQFNSKGNMRITTKTILAIHFIQGPKINKINLKNKQNHQI